MTNAVDVNSPSVFLIEDDENQRRYLATIIESADWTVQPFSSAQAFLNRYSNDQPGCLILDLLLPDTNGLDLQMDLRAREATLPIIFISTHSELSVVKQAFKNGAQDYFQKPVNPLELLDSIKEAIALDTQRREQHGIHRDIETRINDLTTRERTVLNNLLAGQSNHEIAQTLHISVRTVETHRYHILKKMRVNHLHELIRIMANGQFIGLPAGQTSH